MARPAPPTSSAALDGSAAGATTDVHRHRYGWKELATYALGVGASRQELGYLYEGADGGIRVLPSYAVVPAYPAVIELLRRVRAAPERLIHTAQAIRAHRAAPPEGTLSTTGRLVGLYDVKRFAQLVIETETSCDGALLFETTWTIVVQGAGGFGGPRPPRRPRAPRAEPERRPDWWVEQTTAPEQALLYRLSGDPNPLHVDDAVARQAGFERGAILHGLCTFGYVARAVVARAAAGDPSRLRVLSAGFRRPLWPGDALRIAGFRLSETAVALHVVEAEGGEPVLSDCWAELEAP